MVLGGTGRTWSRVPKWGPCVAAPPTGGPGVAGTPVPPPGLPSTPDRAGPPSPPLPPPGMGLTWSRDASWWLSPEDTPPAAPPPPPAPPPPAPPPLVPWRLPAPSSPLVGWARGDRLLPLRRVALLVEGLTGCSGVAPAPAPCAAPACRNMALAVGRLTEGEKGTTVVGVGTWCCPGATGGGDTVAGTKPPVEPRVWPLDGPLDGEVAPKLWEPRRGEEEVAGRRREAALPLSTPRVVRVAPPRGLGVPGGPRAPGLRTTTGGTGVGDVDAAALLGPSRGPGVGVPCLAPAPVEVGLTTAGA